MQPMKACTVSLNGSTDLAVQGHGLWAVAVQDHEAREAIQRGKQDALRFLSLSASLLHQDLHQLHPEALYVRSQVRGVSTPVSTDIEAIDANQKGTMYA